MHDQMIRAHPLNLIRKGSSSHFCRVYKLQTVNFSVDTAHHDITADDLFLLSNDIPRSYSPEIEDDSDSEEMVVGMYALNRIVKQNKLQGSSNK